MAHPALCSANRIARHRSRQTKEIGRHAQSSFSYEFLSETFTRAVRYGSAVPKSTTSGKTFGCLAEPRRQPSLSDGQNKTLLKPSGGVRQAFRASVVALKPDRLDALGILLLCRSCSAGKTKKCGKSRALVIYEGVDLLTTCPNPRFLRCRLGAWQTVCPLRDSWGGSGGSAAYGV